MSNILKIAAAGVEAAPTDYQIERSLRFNSADSAYLSRTPGSSSNLKTWTYSLWIKRGSLGTDQDIFNARNANPVTRFHFNTSNGLTFWARNSSSTVVGNYATSAVYRDVSAWYHIVLVLDTTQATSTDRIKLYVNNVEQSLTASTTLSQNTDLTVNSTETHSIGQQSSGDYFNGYLADINFVDGQALTPSDFGETDATTGVWKPKAYAGTYGTNGFHLDFSDNTSTTTIGYDAAGSNNWTANNFSVAAGAGNDSMVDTPTPYGTDTGAGGEVRGNYCTWNLLSSTATLTNGNLQAATPTTPISDNAFGTIAIPTTGKWYWEITPTVNGSVAWIGIRNGPNTLGVLYTANTGNKFIDGSGSAYGATFTTNDVIGVAVDVDAETVAFYKNGSSQGDISYATASKTMFPYVQDYDSGVAATFVANFGQRPFAYTAPSGFKALCTTNLPTPTIADGSEYFNTVLYSGNSSTQAITGVGFAPDFIWVKGRNTTARNRLFNVISGVQKELYSDLTNAEATDVNSIQSFDSDGFTLGSNDANTSGTNYVGWNWNAGGSNATNTDGTITSTVRANTTAGFSIATYTGTGVGGATIGHGLGAVPKLIITKARVATGLSWAVYHASLGATKNLWLDQTAAENSQTVVWNDTEPTSSVFTVGSAGNANSTQGVVAYCFAEVEGFSKFGSYTGNGSTDGPFVYCGFRPAWILVKKSSASGNAWSLVDTVRDTFNVSKLVLRPSGSDAEVTASVTPPMDILSNGFKMRSNWDDYNGSSATYIFMAFAENPFKYSLAR